MTRSRPSPVRPALALSSLVLLAACSGDSLPTQPPSFGSGRAGRRPDRDYVADSWVAKASMPTARRGLVTAASTASSTPSGPGRNEVNLATVES